MTASIRPMASKSGRRPGSGPSPQSSRSRRPSASTTKAAGSLGPRPDTAIRRALMLTPRSAIEAAQLSRQHIVLGRDGGAARNDAVLDHGVDLGAHACRIDGGIRAVELVLGDEQVVDRLHHPGFALGVFLQDRDRLA